MKPIVSVAFSGLVASVLLSFPTSSDAADDFRVRVEFIDEVDRVSDPPKKNIHVHNKFDVVLSQNGTVSQTFNGKTMNDGYVHDEAGKLGAQAAGNVVWRVASKDHLVGVTDYPNHQRLISIEVRGSSCRAAVAHVLKPGKTVYLAPRLSSREMAAYSKRKTLTSSCKVMAQ